MVTENQNTRKHYRLYRRKNREESFDCLPDMNKKGLLLSILGLTFLKGFFWGYILKRKRR